MIRYKLKIRKSKSTPQVEIPEYHYTCLTEFNTVCSMTKEVLRLTGNKGEHLHVNIKYAIALLTSTGIKVKGNGKYPRLLTTMNNLGKALGVYRDKVYKTLNKIHDIKINDVPLIVFREYKSNEHIQGITGKEKALEIIVTGYEHIKYDDEDFFFPVNKSRYQKELSLQSILLLASLQNITKHKDYAGYGLEYIQKMFNCSKPMVYKMLEELKEKHYIRCTKVGNEHRIYLLDKGKIND